jgi:transglutaminase superfamily protein
MRRVFIIIVVIAIAFCCGFAIGGKRKPASPSFHDMVVNWPHDMTSLVTPRDKRVRDLAAQLKTPENAYAYVRDRIGNDPAVPAVSAGEILSEGRASCLGKAVLLCSLYRAMGVPAKAIRVITGEVEYPEGIVEHAWVDMEYNGVCLQQDATDFFGLFAFDQFRGLDYSRTFIRKEGYAFNDRNFVIVSRLNQLQGMGHPAVR